ncbi:MFS transporter [Mycolicibacterium thermoresistibile]
MTDAVRINAPPETPVRRPYLLVVGLGLVVLTVAVLQTAVVPVLGVMAEQLDASATAVSWAVTGNLLAAAAATPLLGRLADLYSKRRVLLAVLVVVLIGSIMGALTASLPLLITARVLQGASFALYPICVAILRDEIPPERLGRAMAILSGTLGFGGGAGLVVTGLLMTDGAAYQRVFWLASGFTVVAMVITVVIVPTRRRHATGSIDWLGAVGLAAGLSLGLLAITQGSTWGWISPRTGGVAVGAVALLIGWWWWEQRATQPLVSTRMLSRRPMLLTNVATIFVGMGLYFAFLGLTLFVQVPREQAGFGFSASVLEASVVYLLPGAFTGFVVAMISGRFIDRYGARPVLMVAALAGVSGFVFIAVAHSHTWQVIVASLLTNAYISLGYGALPALVISEAPRGATGVATGMNAIARTIGSSTAAALVAVAVAGTASGAPSETGFIAIFLGGAVTATLAMILIALTRTARPTFRTVEARHQSRAMNHEWG